MKTPKKTIHVQYNMHKTKNCQTRNQKNRE